MSYILNPRYGALVLQALEEGAQVLITKLEVSSENLPSPLSPSVNGSSILKTSFSICCSRNNFWRSRDFSTFWGFQKILNGRWDSEIKLNYCSVKNVYLIKRRKIQLIHTSSVCASTQWTGVTTRALGLVRKCSISISSFMVSVSSVFPSCLHTKHIISDNNFRIFLRSFKFGWLFILSWEVNSCSTIKGSFGSK